MKKLVALVILLVAVFVAYTYFSSGTVPFLSSSSQSEEEMDLKQLSADFEAAKKQFRQAGRAAGLTGLDTTSDAGSAIQEIERIERALRTLKPRLKTESGKKEAARLEAEILAFKRGIN